MMRLALGGSRRLRGQPQGRPSRGAACTLPLARPPLLISRSPPQAWSQQPGWRTCCCHSGRQRGATAGAAAPPAAASHGSHLSRSPPALPPFFPSAPLSKGVVSPPRPVPPSIGRPPYAGSGRIPPWSDLSQVQDAGGVGRMRAAGALAARVLSLAGRLVAPGVSTDDLDAAVHAAIVAAGAYPSPLNYGGFPKSVCTSINEVICHGIPDSTLLQEGDIVNVDVTVYLDGVHGDTSATFLVGAVDPEAVRLVEATRAALEAGIAVVRSGARYSAIGAAIQAVADAHGYGVADGFCGHGVGAAFHSGPTILHAANSEPGVMVAGETFTIEPMLCLTKRGAGRALIWDDKWTAVTRDGSWSAQFEHTLLVTPQGAEVLTRREGEGEAAGGGGGGGAAAVGAQQAGKAEAARPQAAAARGAAAKRPKQGVKREWNV